MEDRADAAARCYLSRLGKNENLVGEAASMMEAQEWLDMERSDSSSQAFAGEGAFCSGASVRQTPSFLRRMVAACCVAHELYFWADVYDYIHRPSQARYVRFDQMER